MLAITLLCMAVWATLSHNLVEAAPLEARALTAPGIDAPAYCVPPNPSLVRDFRYKDFSAGTSLT